MVRSACGSEGLAFIGAVTGKQVGADLGIGYGRKGREQKDGNGQRSMQARLFLLIGRLQFSPRGLKGH